MLLSKEEIISDSIPFTRLKDVEKALTEHNIPYKTDCGDVYVGDLKNVVGDNE